jgi:hypothetical protein
MIKSVSDLGRGLSTQVDAFRALGLSAADFEGLSPDEIFKRIADAVQASGKSIQVTGALMDIFGAKIGADLVNLLEQGAAGIEAFEQEIKDLGLELTNVDAAKVELANDAWTRLKAILKGVAQRITVELAPFITALVDKFVDMGKQGEGIGAKITRGMEMIAKAVGFVANIVQGLRVAFLAVLAASSFVNAGIIKGLVKVAEGVEWLLDKLGVLDEGWTESLRKMSDVADQVAKDVRKDLGDAWDDLGSDPWGDRGVDTFERIREEAQKAAEEASKLADEGSGIEKALEPVVEKVEDLKDEIAEVAEVATGAVADVKAPKVGEFREGNLATLGIGGPGAAVSSATKELQQEMLEQLKRMLEKLNNPEPVPLIWEG